VPLNILTAGQSELAAPGGDVAPNPATQSFYAMALVRALGVAARTGVFGYLADQPCLASDLAARLRLTPGATQSMLNLFVAEGLVDHLDPHYALSLDGHRWLDPNSATSITTFLSQSLDYWDSISNLDLVVRGDGVATPRPDADDELGWLRLVRAEQEMSRLISDEVATAIGLPDSARSVVELGSGHAEYVAAMCRRNPRLRATVIGAAGEVAIGREITWETGMEDVITHEVGDIDEADLGGPHDAVICHWLLSAANVPGVSALLDGIRRALRVGGVVAFLRLSEDERPAPSVVAMKLMWAAQSGGASISPSGSLRARLAGAGFATPRAYQLRGNPHFTLHVARAV
jgi:hypothetical protein